MKTSVLGVHVDTFRFNEVVEQCKCYLQGNELKMIFTPNPEAIVEAVENLEFRDILNSGDLVIPDGIGVVLASWLNKNKIMQRVAGIDLAIALLKYIKDTNFSVYFFGASENVAERAKIKMEIEHKGLRIVGCHDGVDYIMRTQEIIDDINQTKPDIVFVGLGMVNQETWIYENAKSLNAKILIGLGGTLDHLAGDVKRAPRILRFCFEWLYRRIKLKRQERQKSLIAFVKKVIADKFRTKNKNY